MKVPNPLWMIVLLLALLTACAHKSAEISDFDEPTNASARSSSQAQMQATFPAGDETCLGDSKQPDIAPGWKLLWQKTFELPIAKPPVADDTQILVLTRSDIPSTGSPYSDTLWALNPQSSDVQWKWGESQTPRQIMRFKLSPKYVASVVRELAESSSPPISESTIVIERDSGHILLSDLKISVEALSDEAIYHWSFGRALNRIDLPTGEIRWHEPKAAESWGYLVTDHDNLYAVGYNGRVYHYDAAEGNLLATGSLGTIPAIGDLIVNGELVIVRSWHGFEGVTAFDLHNMKLQWATPVSYPFLRESNAFGGNWPTFSSTSESAYMYDAQNRLLRVDLKSGQVSWSTPSIEVQPMSPPVAVNEMIYGLFADGTVRAFSTINGASVGIVMRVPLWYWQWRNDAQDWRNRFGGLAQADNTLIVTTGCRSVYAIQRSK